VRRDAGAATARLGATNGPARRGRRGAAEGLGIGEAPQAGSSRAILIRLLIRPFDS